MILNLFGKWLISQVYISAKSRLQDTSRKAQTIVLTMLHRYYIIFQYYNGIKMRLYDVCM